MMPKNLRLIVFYEYLKEEHLVTSKSDFAEKVGKSLTQMSNYFSGKDNFSEKIILQIQKKYPILNADWLLTGHGDMFVNSPNNIDTASAPIMIDNSTDTTMNKNKRIIKATEYLIEHKHLKSFAALAKSLGKTVQYFTDLKKNRFEVSRQFLEDFLIKYPQINREWLINDFGSMLDTQSAKIPAPVAVATSEKRLIPLFEDVQTIGGYNGTIASLEPSDNYQLIDAGDWFKTANLAIRHYGESMDEYKPGSILALKEVKDISLIVWGQDYVIETTEYRITKRLQKGKDSEHITAYSTNNEKYADGRLVHEPIDIPVSSLRRLFIVLGCVIKKTDGTLVKM